MDIGYYNIFLRASLILLLCTRCSLSDDFDVTTIYKLQRTALSNDYHHYYDERVNSVEIHGRNNARGLPFLSQNTSILDPNVGINIETCTAFDDNCNWKLNNFTISFQKTPMQGKNEITTIEDGKILPSRIFHKELSFTFNTLQDSGELSIYLMDSHEGLTESNMYYITITNHDYKHYSDLWKCKSEYYNTYSSVDIAPGYDSRPCNRLADDTFIEDYWQRVEYEFSVIIEEGILSLTVKSNETEMLSLWKDDNDDPLNILYYAIGTVGLTGSIITETDYDELTLVLSEASGSIVSEAFIPTYSQVCVSVMYSKGPHASIALQIIKNDGGKLDLPQLQTSYLDNDWISSIYSTELPDEVSNKPIRIELSVEQPEEILQPIAIQRIAGCNSKGFEDIYVVSTNKKVTEMDFHAYDVAVKRTETDFKEELECLNGGLFDSDRNSCICPAGFMGKTCDIGCGPDRYDTKCSGRCSKTKQGCMKMKLCRPKLGCNCAPGIKGDLCDTECSDGEYGASCKQKCGQCNFVTCDMYTGRCHLGCQEGFYPPFCHTYYKHLNTSPKVLSIDYHTLQVMFSTIPEFLGGKGTPRFYQIQLRETDNDVNTWTEREPILLPTTQKVETNVTELNSGTNYDVRVVLLDIDGNSYQGKDVPVANGFTKCIVPKVDYNLSTVTVGDEKFKVKWEYSQENMLWCKLTHFEVDVNVDWKWEKRYEGGEKTFTLSDLLPGEEYQVRVRGVSVNGPLTFSAPLTVTTQDEAPQAVYATSITSRSHNQIEINWKKPFSSGGKIKKYKVTYKCEKLLACNEDDCSYSAGDVEVRRTSVTLQGLIPHAQYLISIAAMSAFDGPEVQLLATTDMAEPEVSPSMGDSPAVVRTNTTLSVQWKQPMNCTYMNGYLYGYQFELFEPKNPSPIHEGSTHNTSAKFVGLNPHTDYIVKVYVITSGGTNFNHALVINASTRATVPGKVEQLTVYKMGRRMIGLRWALSKQMYGDIRSFTISYRSKHQKFTSFMVKPTLCTAWPHLYCHTINSLRPETEYTLAVQARNNEIAEDGEIAQVIATTKENAPVAPAYIKIVSQTVNNLVIEWGLPNIINGELKSFVITVEETDSANISDWRQYFPIQQIKVNNEQASYQNQLDNLQPATTYAISVAAQTTTLGPAVSITAHTRPPVPRMDGMLELVDSGDNSELSISNSPTLRIHSTSVNQNLLVGFLLVIIPQSSDNSLQETPIANEWLAQELEQQINATFYVAAEFIQDGTETNPAEIVLGKGSDLENGKWSVLWDPVLENEEQYRIGLVAILDYCGVLNVGYTATDILMVNY